MSKEKMTAKDFRKEFQDITITLGYLQNKVELRLYTLCKRFPDVPLGRIPDLNGTPIKAKDIQDKEYISSLSTQAQLNFIEAIENHIAKSERVIQKIIAF